MLKQNVFDYTLRDDYGKILYIGTTDNIGARRAEHRLNGKQFAELRVETKALSRPSAESWESKRQKSTVQQDQQRQVPVQAAAKDKYPKDRTIVQARQSSEAASLSQRVLV